MAILNDLVLKTSLSDLKAKHRGEKAWSEEIILNDRFRVVAIYQSPGHENDWHYHLVDELWFIAEGEQVWEFEGRSEPVYVQAGDFVYAPANTCHLIHVLGNSPAIRIAVSHTGEFHRHERENPPMPARPTAIRKPNTNP